MTVMTKDGLEPDLDAPLAGGTIGQRIRAAYLRAGFNRSQFSKALDVQYSTIYSWEKGQKEPSTTSLSKVAELTGFSMDELAGNVNPPPMRIEREAAYPALTEFLAGPEGQAVTPDEIEQLREVRFRNEPTTLSYRYLLNAIRAGIPEAQQAEIAEFNAQILARALAKGGRMLPPKKPGKKR